MRSVREGVVDSRSLNGNQKWPANLPPGDDKAAAMGVKLVPEQEAMDEMSRRLLAGWTMIDGHCPISGLPLVAMAMGTASAQAHPVALRGPAAHCIHTQR